MEYEQVLNTDHDYRRYGGDINLQYLQMLYLLGAR